MTALKPMFTKEQFLAILKEQEAGSKATDICKKHGISSATFYKYKKKFGDTSSLDRKKIRDLQEENQRLRSLLTDVMLDNARLRGR